MVPRSLHSVPLRARHCGRDDRKEKASPSPRYKTGTWGTRQGRRVRRGREEKRREEKRREEKPKTQAKKPLPGAPFALLKT